MWLLYNLESDNALAGELALTTPKQPRQREPRRNPKRKVQPPPPGTDLQHVVCSCRYVGSPYHKDSVSFAGPPRHRPDASICPVELANDRDRVEAWLHQAVAAGHTGAWKQGYPCYVWYRDGDTIYEARQGSPGSGAYHGYPLQPKQKIPGLP